MGGWETTMCGTSPPPNSHHPAPFAWLLKNILLSKLPWGKKGGPLSCQAGCGARGASGACIFAYSHLVLSVFFLHAATFFVCLIGLTDHKFFHLEGGEKGRAAGYWVEIPGNQYDSRAGRTRWVKRKSSKVPMKRRRLIQQGHRMVTWEMSEVAPVGFQMVNTDPNARTIKSVA